MQTVLETKAFMRTAMAAGMSEDERAAVVDFVAKNPTAGDEIPGTGGCRKLRFAGKGKGKRGAYRVITFYSGDFMPVALLACYAKNAKSDLTPKEAKSLKSITGEIVKAFKPGVRTTGSKK